MNLILLGAPGAGKGTQAQVICEHLHIPTISTGNCLREAVQNGTEMGKAAKSYMDSGKLVPDEVVIGIIKDRLAQEDCKGGFILDGFPRTVPQAEALDKMGVEIDRVIDLEVSDEAILKRMSGRRVCQKCGASFHVDYKPSKKGEACDVCGGELIIRKDDKPETVRERLHVYHEQTEPLKGYYAAKGKLKVVEGQEDIKDTTALTLKALEA
ncbi:MAG: adenylate kinase [Clostridiales bacterium]|uniref:adenylate kinase n=1 Tax=Provencibacterium massiliense TaxID=1841868 RepID=UPI0009A6B9FB|nr:adenylate kinase [Provencibacterium massiliense]PWM36380.1 MAG: adenylate kinase [Clostridiales bacterium]RGB68734.1 adenylate kinase [Harryflintia acetispora]